MARLETGVVKCDDDWEGVFIRGDNALMGFAPALEHLLDQVYVDEETEIMTRIHIHACQDLLNLLKMCDARTEPKVQHVQRVIG